MVISFSKGEMWYDKLFNVKYLPLFHHFKAIYQFPKHIIFLVKIVANTSLNTITNNTTPHCLCNLHYAIYLLFKHGTAHQSK
jgi:hypothetical protein